MTRMGDGDGIQFLRSLIVVKLNVLQCRLQESRVLEFVIVIVEPEVRMINSLFSEFHQIMTPQAAT